MHLTRSHQQKHKTIDEFYSEISQHDHPVDREGSKAMLALIARLRALSDERRVHGLTSETTETGCRYGEFVVGRG